MNGADWGHTHDKHSVKPSVGIDSLSLLPAVLYQQVLWPVADIVELLHKYVVCDQVLRWYCCDLYIQTSAGLHEILCIPSTVAMPKAREWILMLC